MQSEQSPRCETTNHPRAWLIRQGRLSCGLFPLEPKGLGRKIDLNMSTQLRLTSNVPLSRVRSAHPDEPRAVRHEGEWVLYWMTAFRRAEWNFSLERAVDWARELGKPLVVLEALRVDYRWACDRFHAFVMQGMRDNQAAFSGHAGVEYFPYVEPERGGGGGLLASLAEGASVVIGDDYPCFFLPAQLRAARRAVPCRFELVDSNGLYPLADTEKVFSRAFDFRRHLQKNLVPHLAEAPQPDPLAGPRIICFDESARKELQSIQTKWSTTEERDLADPAAVINQLPIDHSVAVTSEVGGSRAANRQLDTFFGQPLEDYGELRNQPEVNAASNLSSHLHWGHISTHQIFAKLCEREQWTPDKLAEKVTGSSKGWWGMSPTAESFLDELLTWREVGFNMASKRRDYDRYESLPAWARDSLEEHASDPREHVYSLEQFEHSQTHDELWNAAQRQLVREGRIHNYLRMLWGKKVLHWSASPREALAIMIELNNKYALDGRDPNSYSGIFWVLGRYDRAWGPERPIFGKIRYMTSDNTARKVRVKEYMKRYAASPDRSLF